MKRFVKYMLVWLIMVGWAVCCISILKADDERQQFYSLSYYPVKDRKGLARVLIASNVVMIVVLIYVVERGERE